MPAPALDGPVCTAPLEIPCMAKQLWCLLAGQNGKLVPFGLMKGRFMLQHIALQPALQVCKAGNAANS